MSVTTSYSNGQDHDYATGPPVRPVEPDRRRRMTETLPGPGFVPMRSRGFVSRAIVRLFLAEWFQGALSAI
jgi:hypothetical protein